MFEQKNNNMCLFEKHVKKSYGDSEKLKTGN